MGCKGLGKSVIVNIIFGRNCVKGFLIKMCLYNLNDCFGYDFVIVNIFGIIELFIIDEYIREEICSCIFYIFFGFYVFIVVLDKIFFE